MSFFRPAITALILLGSTVLHAQETGTPAQSGSYTLTATSPLGSTTTTAHIFSVTTPLSVASPVDPTFITLLTTRPNGAMVVQSDGKTVLYGTVQTTNGLFTGIVRLNPDGSLDNTFQRVAIGAFSIELSRDGRFLLTVSSSGGTSYVRLNADGTTDTTFSSSARASAGHAWLPDGRIINIALSNNTATLTRLNANGTDDASYPPTTVTLAPPVATALDPNYTTVVIANAPDGSRLVSFVARQVVGTGAFGANQSTLIRLQTDGTIDPAFTPAPLPVAMQQMASAADGIHYVATATSGPLGSVFSISTGRLKPSGAPDSSYQSFQWTGASYVPHPVVQLRADGSLVALTGDTLSRYDPNGAFDAEFAGHVTVGSGTGSIDSLIPFDADRLLAVGTFTQLNGVPAAYLARLAPDTHASATRLTNLSVRQFAGTDNATLILGFVVTGQGNKTMLLRGVGPTLANFGVTAPLSDPTLILVDGRGTVQLSNDNWGDNGAASAIASASVAVGAFPLPDGSKDAAALATVTSGSSTIQIGATSTATRGVALAEAYDRDTAPTSYAAARVVNFSARGSTGNGESTLIAGFSITGPNVKRVLIRAVGPSLKQFGIAAPLADPVLTLYRGSTAIASNNDWSGAAELSSTFAATGAFAFSATDSKDAAIVVTLPPGGYTAQVTGANDTTGVVLVEVYEVR
jgi:uncharacterized delta-60 repeat protein